MKLNQNTIETLKNFAGINTNILIKEGDELSTISTMRNILLLIYYLQKILSYTYLAKTIQV